MLSADRRFRNANVGIGRPASEEWVSDAMEAFYDVTSGIDTQMNLRLEPAVTLVSTADLATRARRFKLLQDGAVSPELVDQLLNDPDTVRIAPTITSPQTFDIRRIHIQRADCRDSNLRRFKFNVSLYDVPAQYPEDYQLVGERMAVKALLYLATQTWTKRDGGYVPEHLLKVGSFKVDSRVGDELDPAQLANDLNDSLDSQVRLERMQAIAISKA